MFIVHINATLRRHQTAKATASALNTPSDIKIT